MSVESNIKKLLRGKKACSPISHLWLKRFNGTMIKGARQIGQGEYGKVFRGCIDDKCEKYIVYKETTDPSAKMEFTIAKKLEEFSVPKMYLYKSCDNKDVLYSEYIRGEELGKWWKSSPSLAASKSVMAQVIYNLYKIQQKYPGFRHHDLHSGNILVRSVPKKNIQIKLNEKTFTIPNGGVEAVIIDFGFSVFPRIKNPLINNKNYINIGISRKSDKMYDLHFFLNSMYALVRQPKTMTERRIHNFIRSVLPFEYLNKKTERIKNYRMRGNMNHRSIPNFEKVLTKPFFTGENPKALPIPITKPQKPVVLLPNKPKTPVNQKEAMARAIAILKTKKTKQQKRRPAPRIKV